MLDERISIFFNNACISMALSLLILTHITVHKWIPFDSFRDKSSWPLLSVPSVMIFRFFSFMVFVESFLISSEFTLDLSSKCQMLASVYFIRRHA